MESRTVSTEALVDWEKCFIARNNYVDDCHVKGMRNFGHHVDEEEDGGGEDEESEEDSKEEEGIK